MDSRQKFVPGISVMELAKDLSILFVLFAMSGFFSGTETALFSLSKLDKRRLQTKHPKLAHWVFFHLDRPRRTLLTILTGNLLVNTLAAAMATLIILRLWGASSLGMVMAAYVFIFILFCEITPKILAARQNETFAAFAALPLEVFAVLFFPLRYLNRFVTDRIISMMIRDRKDSSDVISEDELKALVKIGEEEGVLDRQERTMIHKLFELGERPVREIATPRVDMKALDIEDPADKHAEIIKACHFTHFPVYRDSPDNILGVISVQDYMLSGTEDLRPFLKQPLFVPESKHIDDLLEEFRKKKETFAVCVDEYGGTFGIVTLEDILEEIFGEYYDEYSKVENPIKPFGYNEYLVDAKISISDFNDFFSSQLAPEEAATLAGFIFEEIGEVPQVGRVVKTPELDIRIHKVVRHRIISVLVRLK